MKKIFANAFILFVLFAFTKDNTRSADRVKNAFLMDIKLFKNQIDTTVLVLKNKKQVQSLYYKIVKSQFLTLRLSYKKIEPLFEYFFQNEAREFNGAPLPKLDESQTHTYNVILPKGLQVIESLVCDQNMRANTDSIIFELNYMKAKLQSIEPEIDKIYFTDRNVFEALRKQLIRITALGLSGFDVPVSKNAIPEIVEGLKTADNYLSFYDSWMVSKDVNKASHIHTLYQNAIKWFDNNKNFEKLDRAQSIIQYINPIYEELYTIHKLLNIETFKETYNKNESVNYETKSLVSKDFLNPLYFSPSVDESFNPEIVALGKLLFFDPILSADNKRACASCHLPNKAFTDGVPKSVAKDMAGTVRRNSPTLINSAYQTKFFWDGRASFPEDQMRHVVFDKKEFATTHDSIHFKLKASIEYVQLFKSTFPSMKSEPIQQYTVSKALAAYVRSLNALNSPFDKYLRGEEKNIEPQVLKGFTLFMGKGMCGTCHFYPIFNGLVPPFYNDTEAEVLGTPANPYHSRPILDEDEGKYGYFKYASEIYKNAFKTPTIRNVALTAPYMHNGAYRTLEDVVDFYNRGGGVGIGLDVPNQTLPFDKLNLTKQEQKDLVAFMKALTDTVGITSMPATLPCINGLERKIGGEY